MGAKHHLIAGSRIEGASVFSAGGDKLGKIDDLMIDKESGRTVYALMSFGGFLGAGQRYYPLPWSALDYNKAKGAFIVSLTREQIEAGHHVGDKEIKDEIDWRESVHNYYGATPYW